MVGQGLRTAGTTGTADDQEPGAIQRQETDEKKDDDGNHDITTVHRSKNVHVELLLVPL